MTTTLCHLLNTLQTHSFYACGTTLTPQIGFPETLKQEHCFCQRGHLVASVWMDKKPVNMLSTLAQTDVTHTAQRKQKDGSKVSVQCTDAVVLYNKYMAGVDKGHQHRQYYQVSTKYYRYIFWFLFEVSITNYLPLSHQRHIAFCLKLADQLVGNYNNCKRPGHLRSLPAHFPPPTPDSGPQASRTALHLPLSRERRRCVYCSQYPREV